MSLPVPYTSEPTCCGTTSDGYLCYRKAVVFEPREWFADAGDKPWCKIHAPSSVAERRAKSKAKSEAKRQSVDQLRASAQSLCDEVKDLVGYSGAAPHYGPNGWTGYVVLSPRVLKALLDMVQS